MIPSDYYKRHGLAGVKDYIHYLEVRGMRFTANEEGLKGIVKLHEHLLARNFNPDIYTNITLDGQGEILTVHLFDFCGRFVGFQQYNHRSDIKTASERDLVRYFTYRTAGTHALWGLERLDPKQQVCFVVEGIFKASALHMLGLNAIAVLCNNPKGMMQQLRLLPYRFIAIGDNDKAGQKLVSTVGEGVCFERDVDEYSLGELKKMIYYIMECAT